MTLAFRFFLLTCLYLPDVFGQQVEWICYFNQEQSTGRLSKTWIGPEGDIYVNVIQSSYSKRESYTNLVHVSSGGEAKTILSNKFQGGIGMLFPMTDGHYLSDGIQEDPDQKTRRRFRLLDSDGKPIAHTEPMIGKIYGRLQNGNEYIWLNSPSEGFGIHDFYITRASNSFDVHLDTVSLKSIWIDSMGITDHSMDPVMLEDKSISISGLYGFTGNLEFTGMSPNNGVVFNIKDGQVAWKYPLTLSLDKLEAIAANRNFTWALFASPKRVRTLVKINENGKAVLNRDIHLPYSVVNFILLDKKIILLGPSSIYIYSLQCKLLGEYSLGEYSISDFKDIIPLSEDSFIVTGTKMNQIAVVKMKLL